MGVEKCSESTAQRTVLQQGRTAQYVSREAPDEVECTRIEQVSERIDRDTEITQGAIRMPANPNRRTSKAERPNRSSTGINLYANLPESKRKTFVIGLFNLMKVEEGLNEPCTSTNG